MDWFVVFIIPCRRAYQPQKKFSSKKISLFGSNLGEEKSRIEEEVVCWDFGKKEAGKNEQTPTSVWNVNFPKPIQPPVFGL